nr:hypothetical protein CFP56_11330 [Quercus suber]
MSASSPSRVALPPDESDEFITTSSLANHYWPLSCNLRLEQSTNAYTAAVPHKREPTARNRGASPTVVELVCTAALQVEASTYQSVLKSASVELWH